MSVAVASGQTADPFHSLKASVRFPGRSTLRVNEVAGVLQISEDHVVDLIQEGLLGALNVAGSSNKSARSFYRIPVCEYDAYILNRGKYRNGK